MDNRYLLELIEEAKNRGGGLLLNANGKPELVVLTIQRYNEILSTLSNQALSQLGEAEAATRKILVTGGAGYIGAHVVKELLKEGYQVVVLDNLSTGLRENLSDNAKFIEGDLGDVNLLKDLFASEKFDAVIHLAASVEVEESVKYPEKYFINNALNTFKLLSVMNEYEVKKLIFSSTAAVYGRQEVLPIKETSLLEPDNPYGYSKVVAEQMVNLYCKFYGFAAVVFRYFNACGSDFDGKIVPTHFSHLLPNILAVAQGAAVEVVVNGDDYQTFDGSCVRDFVHVLDIARAHTFALSSLNNSQSFEIYNIGTGKGYSVKQVINKVSEVLNKIIPMQVGPRRAGDAPETVADNSKITSNLGFRLRHSDLETIITTSWNQLQKQII